MTWGINHAATDLHVVPCDDLRPHQDTEACWCCPSEDEVGVWVHHAMDGREAFESGERMPS